MKNNIDIDIAVAAFALVIGAAAVIAAPLLSAYNADPDADYGSHRSRKKAAYEERRFFAVGDTFVTWIDGDNIRYYGIRDGFRFERPYRWHGRSRIENDALLSSGFAPFNLDFRGQLLFSTNPDEELRVTVRATDKDLDAIANERATNTATSMTMGGKPAIRYVTADGHEVVTAKFNRKQYDIILKSQDASERFRDAFEHAIKTFKFIDNNFRVL
jgi:hypothetical protein